ncbi:MAG: S4 domain-containing protein YaaA [Candidatus Izemoplasmatales bacterium]
MKEIIIKTEYITLGQFLKHISIVSSGGEVKFFLKNNKIFVNSENENRRGKKLYPGDKITILNEDYKIIKDVT